MRWFRRLFCAHDGPMYYVRSGTLGGLRFSLWQCQRCGEPIFEENE